LVTVHLGHSNIGDYYVKLSLTRSLERSGGRSCGHNGITGVTQEHRKHFCYVGNVIHDQRRSTFARLSLEQVSIGRKICGTVHRTR
jgi:hypothetical protein